jgi:hypothetical protein
MINELEYFQSRIPHLHRVLNTAVPDEIEETMRQLSDEKRREKLPPLYKALEVHDEKMSSLYHRTPTFRALRTPPIVSLPRHTPLFHVSQVHFSPTKKPSNKVNYFLGQSPDLVPALQYILLWKFTADPGSKSKTWYVNKFQTKSRLRLLQLSPMFNLSDAKQLWKTVQTTRTSDDVDLHVCNYMLSQVDGTTHGGEWAGDTLQEIALCQSTVSIKVEYVSSMDADEFFQRQR